MLINHCIQNANSILLFLESGTFSPHNLLPINLKGSMHKDQLAQKSWLASFSLQFQCFIKTIVQIYMLEISFLKSGLCHFAQVTNVPSWDQAKGNKWAFQRRLPWPHARPHAGAWLSEPHSKAPTALTSAPCPRWWDGPACPGEPCAPQRPSTGAKTRTSPWLFAEFSHFHFCQMTSKPKRIQLFLSSSFQTPNSWNPELMEEPRKFSHNDVSVQLFLLKFLYIT